jgi:hypothetical protein
MTIVKRSTDETNWIISEDVRLFRTKKLNIKAGLKIIIANLEIGDESASVNLTKR